MVLPYVLRYTKAKEVPVAVQAISSALFGRQMIVQLFLDGSLPATRLMIAFSSDTSAPVGTLLSSAICCQIVPTEDPVVETTVTAVIESTKYCLKHAAHLEKLSNRTVGSRVDAVAIAPEERELERYGEGIRNL